MRADTAAGVGRDDGGVDMSAHTARRGIHGRRLLRSRRVRAGVALALLLTAGACGETDKQTSGSSALDTTRAEKVAELAAGMEPQGGPGETVKVIVRDNVFDPEVLVIKPGTTVQWVNEGRNSHNIYPALEGDFAPVKTGDFGPGDVASITFDDPAEIFYYCTIHGTLDKNKLPKGQKGLIVVSETPVDAAATDESSSVDGGDDEAAATINVPDDYPTIQAAVDAAEPGALILIAPGTYHEAVVVTTPELVIRGLDRNEVVLDGEFELENGFKVVEADGVAIENMTAINYTRNGFFWTGVTGYRGSYLSTTRTGDYGIYAFDSTKGQFDHSYGSGSPDAGFYIGQCNPCDAVLDNVIAEYNGLGWSGTNASKNLLIVNSIFRYNRAGIVPNSGDGEALPPEDEQTIVGNLVYSNNNGQTPAIDAAKLGQGNGILVAGGINNVIERNLVWDHEVAGIAAVPNPDKTFWISSGNKVRGNVVSDSGEADLAYFGGEGNCFEGNTFATSRPSNIEQVAPCSGTGIEATDALDLQKYIDATKPASVDYKNAPTPPLPKLEGMKDPKTAKAEPATNVPMKIDLAAIKVPTKPTDLGVAPTPAPAGGSTAAPSTTSSN